MFDLNLYAWLFIGVCFLLFTFVVCPICGIFAYFNDTDKLCRASYFDLLSKGGVRMCGLIAFIFAMSYLFEKGFS